MSPARVRTQTFGRLSKGLYPNRGGLDSFAMPDDGGVLGNLPNKRPGRRSEKRQARSAAPRQPSPRSAPAAEARADEGDPVSGAIRTAAGLAAAGARVANGVAREVVRRLPRP